MNFIIKNKLSILLIILFVVSLNSCCIMGMRGQRSTKTIYDDFYISEGVMQYFVKPITFKSKDYKFTLDFTFRDSITTSYATCNYSLFSEEPVSTIDSAIILVDNNQKIIIKNNKKLFVSKKKKYQIRYSGGITNNELKIFFKGTSFEVNIYNNNSKIVLKPSNKTLKSIELFNKEVVDIIELNQ